MSEAPESGPARTVRAQNTPGRRLALIVFLLSPLAVLAVLMVLIAISIKQPKKMNEPAIGAGAGQTGMINEYVGKKPEQK